MAPTESKRSAVLNILNEATVIPVLEVERLEDAAPLALSLAAGGLNVAELTMRTEHALEAMQLMQAAAPDLIIGMGTIRSLQDASAAADAGAAFLVSPGAGPNLLSALAELSIPSLPGVATASEAMTAQEQGFDVLKFFPAESAGGVDYLKALYGPLPDIRFCPTGGIGADLAPQYLSLPNVVCVGGSWIAPRKLIEAGDWKRIEDNAQRAANMGDT